MSVRNMFFVSGFIQRLTRFTAATSFVIGLFAAGPIMAEEQSRLYIGTILFGAVHSESEEELSNNLARRGHSVAVSQNDRFSPAGELYLGYQLTSAISAEIAVAHLGRYKSQLAITGNSNPQELARDIQDLFPSGGPALRLGMRVEMPVSELFGLAFRYSGVYLPGSEIEVSFANGTTTSIDSRSRTGLGIGLGSYFNLGRNLKLTSNFEFIGFRRVSYMLFGLGLEYKFLSPRSEPHSFSTPSFDVESINTETPLTETFP